MEFSFEQIQAIQEALQVVAMGVSLLSDPGTARLSEAEVAENPCLETALKQFLLEDAYEPDPNSVIELLAPLA